MLRTIPLIISLLLLLTNFLPLTKNFSSSLHNLVSPISVPVSNSKNYLSQSLGYIQSIPTLVRQLKYYKQQNLELLIKVETLSSTINEFKTVKSLTTPHQTIVPVSFLSSSALLTVFTNDSSNLKSGQALVENNSLLGIVKEVFSHTASVTSLSDSEISIPIVTSNNLLGTYTVKQSSPTITLIDSSKDLPLGTAIFTAGSENHPKDLLLGTVTKIVSKISDTSQVAKIELATSPNLARHPYIITSF